jgi:hypothetical protein
MLLRDLPMGTSADLTDCTVAWWDGHQVVFGFLCEDATDAIDEEFDLGDYEWQEWQAGLTRWAAQPKFSMRPQVRAWLNESPPFDLSV